MELAAASEMSLGYRVDKQCPAPEFATTLIGSHTSIRFSLREFHFEYQLTCGHLFQAGLMPFLQGIELARAAIGAIAMGKFPPLDRPYRLRHWHLLTGVLVGFPRHSPNRSISGWESLPASACAGQLVLRRQCLALSNQPRKRKSYTRPNLQCVAAYRSLVARIGDRIAEGDYVVGRWDGGGTHMGPAFDALPMGSLPAHSERKMLFTGTTVFRIENGTIVEEIGEEGALTALQQLGLCPAGKWPVRSVTA
jgi:hypothetical protein